MSHIHPIHFQKNTPSQNALPGEYLNLYEKHHPSKNPRIVKRLNEKLQELSLQALNLFTCCLRPKLPPNNIYPAKKSPKPFKIIPENYYSKKQSSVQYLVPEAKPFLLDNTAETKLYNDLLNAKSALYESFILKVVAYFENNFAIKAEEFHHVLGRDYIFRRHDLTANIEQKRLDQCRDYANHIAVALNFVSYVKGRDNYGAGPLGFESFSSIRKDPNQPEGLQDINLSKLCRESLQSCFTNQKNAVEAIQSCFKTKSHSLILNNENKSNKFDVPLKDWKQLYALPPHIGQLVHIRDLDLTGNYLSSLPPEIGNLVNLKTLSLKFNRFWGMPSVICPLRDLISLNMSANQLRTLPADIGKLASLIYLDLHHNRITHLSPKIGQLIHLEEIILNYNKIKYLPPQFKQLKNLRILDLSYNILNKFPKVIGQCTNLEYLCLRYTGLKNLSPVIGNLNKLQTLFLGKNELEGLPPQCAKLTDLRDLFLNDTGIKELPAWIGEMQNLRVLNIENNNLSTLPAEIGKLRKLELLDWKNNQFIEFPKEILDIQKLENMENCPYYQKLKVESQKELLNHQALSCHRFWNLYF